MSRNPYGLAAKYLSERIERLGWDRYDNEGNSKEEIELTVRGLEIGLQFLRQKEEELDLAESFLKKT